MSLFSFLFIENERKLQFAERQHRIELEAEKARTEDVLKKLKSQENRFADTLEALGAASRLSESIDIKEQTIAQMKIEGKFRFESPVVFLSRSMFEVFVQSL
jgi:hypothetical protein